MGNTAGRLEIAPRRVAGALLAAMVGLHLLNAAAQVLVARGTDGPLATAFVEVFRVNSEGVLPTWYSAATLLLCAALLAVIAVAIRRRDKRFPMHWACLSLIFLYISVDEGAAIHDRLSAVLGERIETSGVLTSTWVVPALIVLPVLAAAYVPFLLRLPTATRRLFVLAGGCYVLGALGLEMVGGIYDAGGSIAFLPYEVLATLEEILEMTGILIFLYALLMYLAVLAPIVRLRFAPRSGAYEAASE